MFRWTPYALVRIASFFVAGILFGIYVPEFFSARHLTFVCIILIVIYFVAFIGLRGKTLALISGTVGLIAVLLLGYLHVTLRTHVQQPGTFVNTADSVNAYIATIRSVPEEKKHSWKVEVALESFRTQQWHLTEGKMLLYVSKKMGEPNWLYGDRILVSGSPQLLKPPANPGEFDFQRFLRFKNIYHQHFVRVGEVEILPRQERKGFIFYSHQARHWCMERLHRFMADKQEQAIAAALILGVTDGIDNELQNAYAASGAMHVLAVSGLHVGIIYAMLLLLMKPLQKFSWSRWFVALVSLVCLWTFAFITGLSPSVLRAVTMFSFVAMARPFGARTNIYNTLAASAFVLLIYNPYLIMSVGFQLSYLAVLGIVYLQRPLYQLLEIENRFVDWAWQITCVSIAAQLATCSLSLLYFHQFPVYFLVSNLFVIPLSTIILVVGIGLLAASGITWLAALLAKLTSVCIWLLNQVVFVVEDWPLSIISNIHINTWQCWLLMGCLLCLSLLIEFRNIYWLLASTLFAGWFSLLAWLHFQESINRSQWVVYQLNGRSAFEFTKNGHSYFFADSALQNDPERIGFHILPNRLLCGVAKVDSVAPFQKRMLGLTFYYWQQKTVAHVNKALPPITGLEADYLLVSHQALPPRKIVDNRWRIKRLIADGSNSQRYIEQLRKFAIEQKIPFYATADSGAFILKN